MKIKWKIGALYYSTSTRRASVGKEYGTDPAFERDFNLDNSEQSVSNQDAQPVISSVATCDWLSGVLERLKQFRKLGDDWDGYGAASPKPEVLAAAESFIQCVATTCRISRPSVSPTRIGGVLFSWKHEPHRLEVQYVSRDAASFAYLNTKTGKGDRGALFSDSQDARFWAILHSYFDL